MRSIKKTILTIKLFLLILKFNLIQTKIGRKIVRGSFYLIQPKMNELSSFWITEKLTKYEDEVIEEEHYGRILE